MRKSIYAIYGASGYGREVMPLAREQLRREGIPTERLVFVDDGAMPSVVNGQRVLSYAEFLRVPAASRHAAFAIADGGIRRRLWERCDADAVRPWSVVSGTTVVMDEVEIGEGAILCPFVTLTSNIRIGRHFHANLYSYVAHDCVIGDYVTFAPGVKCNGNVVVEDGAYVGAGAVIKQGRPRQPRVIGQGAIVGMGAVVTKDVPPGATAVGNPARTIQGRVPC